MRSFKTQIHPLIQNTNTNSHVNLLKHSSQTTHRHSRTITHTQTASRSYVAAPIQVIPQQYRLVLPVRPVRHAQVQVRRDDLLLPGPESRLTRTRIHTNLNTLVLKSLQWFMRDIGHSSAQIPNYIVHRGSKCTVEGSEALSPPCYHHLPDATPVTPTP